MPRPGKELEEIVAILEQTLLPSNASVVSPAFLEDKVTGEPREIDICVTIPAGSVEVVVIIECRDRHAVQDVTWIEQLAQKRSDVLASKAVAVSSSGFSQAAKRKALFYGIDLRTIEELDSEVVKSWLNIQRCIFYERKSLVHGISLTLDSKSASAESKMVSGPISPDGRSKNFFSRIWDCWLSLIEIWDIVQESFDVHEQNSLDGEKMRRQVDIVFDNPGDRFRFSHEMIEADVIRFSFDVELWLEARQVPLHRAFSYQTDEAALIATAEYKATLGEQEEIVSIYRDLKTEHYSVSRRVVSSSPSELTGSARSISVRLRPLKEPP